MLHEKEHSLSVQPVAIRGLATTARNGTKEAGSSPAVLLALFPEVNGVADALDALRGTGIQDEAIDILSGVPYRARVLGRPAITEKLPRIVLIGAAIGFLTGAFLSLGTPLLYPIHVGGQPLLSIPTSAIIIYELTMLGLIVSTFLGVLWQSAFPAFGKKPYHREVSNGQIAVLFQCPSEHAEAIRILLQGYGAERVSKPEMML